MSAVSHSVAVLMVGAGLLALAGCSEKPAEASAEAAKPREALALADEAEAPPPAIVSRKSEWSIGGIIKGTTETTRSEPLPAPPVVFEPPKMPARQVEPQSGLLTAGDYDDLLNPSQYAAYAGRFLQASGSDLPFYDTRSRVVIRVVDARGKPVPFAQTDVRRGGKPLHLVTAADGTATFYPRADKVPAQTTIAVTSSAGDASRTVALADHNTVQITLPGNGAPPSAMDLALVIDTTGSMGDEMDYLQAELDTIVARLKRNAGNLDLRIGVILYRDEGDQYVVKSVPLTGDVASIRTLLADQTADGGGDTPEAMDQALAAAQKLQWRANAAKAMLLLTDAPPHEDRLTETLDATQQLRSRGVQIVPVAASGVEDTAQYVLRSMAALTQGRYIFLTDDSGVGNAHAEPDVSCYLVTHLDQLVARVLAGIATGQRIEPRSGDVIRAVGDYDRGRCRTQQQTAREDPARSG